MRAVETLASGTMVQNYRIQAVVGAGGMGVVYRAEHVTLATSVALKVIRPDLAHDPDFRVRFLREARVAASLDHPNIIPVYDAGEAGDRLFLAMRFVEGVDLASMLAPEVPLDPARSLSLLRQVGEALDEAHEHGLVHRDVKPANIMVAPPASKRPREHAYLTDFGLVKRIGGAGTRLTRAGYFLGTPDYVAPELLTSHDIDGRADQYALACVMFQCLAGSVPFPREFEAAIISAHISLDPPDISERRGDLPRTLDAVVRRGMAKDPAARFGSCTELVDRAIEAAGLSAAPLPSVPAVAGPTTGGRSTGTGPAPPWSDPAPPRRHRGIGIAVATLIAVTAIAVGAVTWDRAGSEPEPAAAAGPCGGTVGEGADPAQTLTGRIAFVSDRAGSHLFVLDVARGRTTPLTSDEGTESNPSWSPDGSRIAFDSDRDGDFDIYVMNADGSDVTRLTGPGAEVSAAWSPDGRTIAFAATVDGNSDVFVMPAGGGGARPVTDHPAHDGQPTWSPDGQQLAFSSDRSGNDEIYVAPASGGRATDLTRSAASDRKPSWSPDGGTIAFVSERQGDADIYLMDTNGAGVRSFTDNAVSDGYPTWSPDGRWLLHDSEVAGTTDVCVVPVAGGAGLHLIRGEGLDAIADWTT